VWLVAGYACARRAAAAPTSAWAARKFVLDASRPKMRSHPLARFRRVPGDMRGMRIGWSVMGAHTSG